jgi:Ca2+-binding EF-hand superfamily protein
MNISQNSLSRAILAALVAGILPCAAIAQDDAPKDGRPSDLAPTDGRPDGKRPEGKKPSGERPADPIGKAIDSDGNHVISAAELANAPVALLALDADKDGKLSKGECGHKKSGEQRGRATRMAMLDKDKDGKISKEEAGERLGDRFAEMDKNTDGFIDKEEMKAMRGAGKSDGKAGGQAKGQGKGQAGKSPEGKPEDGARPQGDKPKSKGQGQGGRGGEMRRRGGGSPFMRAIDADHNGELSADEIKGSTVSLTKLDKNKDGQLTKEEIMPARGRRGDGGGGAGRMGGFFERMDQDGDGKISREEAPGRMADRFDDLDGDGDGFITQAEMTEAMERMRR